MALPNVNPSPRQTFQESAEGMRRHLDLIADPVLRHSLTAAMSQLDWKLSHGSENPEAMHFMRVGAHEFLDIFFTLSSMSSPAKAKAVGTLTQPE
jgi:hypothetical protein